LMTNAKFSRFGVLTGRTDADLEVVRIDRTNRPNRVLHLYSGLDLGKIFGSSTEGRGCDSQYWKRNDYGREATPAMSQW
jgi:hypothetical protein